VRIGYIVSKFPSNTETFIAREMGAIKARGQQISLFSLVTQPEAVVHPEAEPFVPGLVHAPAWSLRVVTAQFYWLGRRPGRYLSSWTLALAGNIRSPRFFVRALAVVPTAAWYAREALDRDLDRVHAHWATHSGLAAWVVGRLTGLPYSITAHAHDIFVDHSMLERKLRDADFVAVISEFNRSYLAGLYGDSVTSNFTLVRCGVDLERFAPESEQPQRQSAPVILCIGSLEEYKGHAVLFRALEQLRETGVAMQVRLVGTGPLRSTLEADVQQRNLQSVVTFLGALPSDEVVQELRNSDIVVQPSIITSRGKMEGIPVALMEAGASARPVVASRLSGIPELIENEATGLLVTPGDASELAIAIGRLIDDPAMRQSLGSAARRRVATEFGVDANADRLLAAMGVTVVDGAGVL
jgi:glycosyltransferase involved in cell wall biosynthesis